MRSPDLPYLTTNVTYDNELDVSALAKDTRDNLVSIAHHLAYQLFVWEGGPYTPETNTRAHAALYLPRTLTREQCHEWQDALDDKRSPQVHAYETWIEYKASGDSAIREQIAEEFIAAILPDVPAEIVYGPLSLDRYADLVKAHSRSAKIRDIQSNRAIRLQNTLTDTRAMLERI